MAASASAAPAVGRVLVMGATDFGAIGRDPGAGKNVCCPVRRAARCA